MYITPCPQSQTTLNSVSFSTLVPDPISIPSQGNLDLYGSSTQLQKKKRCVRVINEAHRFPILIAIQQVADLVQWNRSSIILEILDNPQLLTFFSCSNFSVNNNWSDLMDYVNQTKTIWSAVSFLFCGSLDLTLSGLPIHSSTLASCPSFLSSLCSANSPYHQTQLLLPWF